VTRIVDPGRSGLRLDKFWALELERHGISRARIIQWIKQNRATLNAEPCPNPSQKVRTGDRLGLVRDLPPGSLVPIPGPLDILWQDEHLLVLDKPPGLAVHPAPSIQEPTLAHYLLAAFPETASQDPFRPGIVHRLDKDTSGLMLAARTRDCRERLMQDLAARRLEKTYLALVHGRPATEQGRIDLPLGRDPKSKTRQSIQPKTGRDALTFFRVLHVFPHEDFSLLQLRIVTGRTHQIRVHLAHAGCPILGDKTYGPAHFAELQRQSPRLVKLCRRQMLHAFALHCKHPITGHHLQLQRAVPKDFQRVLLQLVRRPQIVAVSGPQAEETARFCTRVAQKRSPVWDWGESLSGLLQAGSDGLAFLEKAGGLVREPGEALPAAREAFSSDERAGPEGILMRDMLLPLLKHDLWQFIAHNKTARLLLVCLPPLLLRDLQQQGLFDIQLRLGTSAEISVSEGDQAATHRIIAGKDSPEELDRRAGDIQDLLRRSRRGRVRAFLRQLGEKGIVNTKGEDVDNGQEAENSRRPKKRD
jgi:23S rRNA pseudouridine1911/1915/1917 synthase